jgi:hypothetical protein
MSGKRPEAKTKVFRLAAPNVARASARLIAASTIVSFGNRKGLAAPGNTTTSARKIPDAAIRNGQTDGAG